MADVFFSYKREDRASVEPLVRLLEREGLTVWWDPTLVAGQRFGQVINTEIENAACVVVAWSKNSVNAEWVCDEASIGKERGILVPLSIDGARPPLGFRSFQTPDLTHWQGRADDPLIRQLLAGVVAMVRGSDAAIDLPAAVEAQEPAPERPGDVRTRTGISRRRFLQVGAAAGVVGAASAGLWIGGPRLWTKSLPPVHAEDFDLVTVDARGAARPPQRQNVDVFEVLLDGTAMQFSIVPAGRFEVGSPEAEPLRRPIEGPQRLVELREFAIGRTVVTQAQWAAVLRLAPDTIEQTLPDQPSFFRGDDLPVETIGWYHAVEFCRRLSEITGLPTRLPTETEWEYACRAGTTSPFHFGPTLTPELANYCGTGGAVCDIDPGSGIARPTYGGVTYESGAYGDGPVGIFRGTTTRVGSYPSNRFGLFEMHGNVWEHCYDTGPVDYRQVPTDGSPYRGLQELRVLRGGAWSHNPAICRSAYRDAMPNTSVGWPGRVGMRVVCELSEP